MASVETSESESDSGLGQQHAEAWDISVSSSASSASSTSRASDTFGQAILDNFYTHHSSLNTERPAGCVTPAQRVTQQH